MSDLIDRQKAIEAISNLPVKIDDLGYAWMIAIDVLKQIDDVPSAEPERKWIPVSERLPEIYTQAIVIDSRGSMMIGTYEKYGWVFPCYMTEPVAWMPLPKAYRGE